MLCLSRKPGEAIRVSDDVIITVLEIKRDGGVRLGITAPKEVPVWREEIYQEIKRNEQR